MVLVVGFDAAGSDGPTVRLAGSVAGMTLLRAACERLAAGAEAIALGDLDGVQLDSIAEVHLRRGRHPGRLQLTGRCRPVVVFDGTTEQWETRARLLDPLIDQPGTGFQYLDYGSTGDATVIAETTT
jgi:hypothetical protein